MPTVMVERAEARPFESQWLSWLGPWRFSFGDQPDGKERQDIDSPLFMAWRVVVMPFKKIEFGFSRTAQFCGEQLAVHLDVFGNMMAGNDNVGIDATPENEPGNQMAGFDIRWNSPLGNLAVRDLRADRSVRTNRPICRRNTWRSSALEVWKPMVDGGMVQGIPRIRLDHLFGQSSSGPYYNCAYNQGQIQRRGISISAAAHRLHHRQRCGELGRSAPSTRRRTARCGPRRAHVAPEPRRLRRPAQHCGRGPTDYLRSSSAGRGSCSANDVVDLGVE